MQKKVGHLCIFRAILVQLGIIRFEMCGSYTVYLKKVEIIQSIRSNYFCLIMFLYATGNYTIRSKSH